MSPGIFFNYWTYNGQVPGPFIRARVEDKINLTLKNHPSSLHHHSIDLHAVNGPGGGATVTMVEPGNQKLSLSKPLTPAFTSITAPIPMSPLIWLTECTG